MSSSNANKHDKIPPTNMCSIYYFSYKTFEASLHDSLSYNLKNVFVLLE